MKYGNMSLQEKNGKLYKSSKKLFKFSLSYTLHVAFSLLLVRVCICVCMCACTCVFMLNSYDTNL